ncbi:isoaspartyl peptidase/L-asparaginase family protein [Salisaeta longa]|uniref:isoaspartyl peptidase/L-asparaginase family protein n=1 Tax=Salisaeta longa TaxID=503170 RepID=UPI000400D2FD|nr:isoaspartyl peptidase/L-asparaginase [Salisaeta longa]
MSTLRSLLVALLLIGVAGSASAQTPPPLPEPPQRPSAPIALVIHGGAGSITELDMSEAQEQAYRAALQTALQAGYEVLQSGGSSVNAVIAAITTMEDNPLFNAGKGAVFTSENTVELDASIMNGANRNAGAVTGIKHVRSPIKLAYEVMTESPHVMLAGDGAETFAKQQGLPMVENSYFYTEKRLKQSKENDTPSGGDAATPSLRLDPGKKFGTVGAVALDKNGNLAAGTSTGGMTNKRFGRIGDSPIIGAGTYAHNATCAVSATGYGEYFIRGVIAHTVAAQMQYGNASLDDAARAAIHDVLPSIGSGEGTGGIIALDRKGNIAMPFNTPGMFRAYIDTSGTQVVRFFGPDAYSKTNAQ